MPTSGRCRLFKRNDGKYLIYMPLNVAEDSMFPFKLEKDAEGKFSLALKVSFKIGDKKLIIEPMEAP